MLSAVAGDAAPHLLTTNVFAGNAGAVLPHAVAVGPTAAGAAVAGPNRAAAVPAAAATAMVIKVDDPHITPAMAGYTDLHLLSVYGGEKINVPVQFFNPSLTKPINGTVDLSFYISESSSPSGNPFYTTTKGLSIGKCMTAELTTAVTVPSDLTAGTSYYIVVDVKSTNLQIQGGPVSSASYEYLGVPSYNTAVFSGGLYLKFVKETIEGISAAKRQNPKVNVTDPMSFIETFEGDSTSPYLDSENIATIGVGINLTTLSASLRTSLAAAVRTFYADPANHETLDVSKYTDSQVVSMLISQATGHKTNVASKQAFTSAQDSALFTQAYNEEADDAEESLSSVWGQMSTQAQIAIVDLVYNAGSVWSGVASALNGGPDYLRGVQPRRCQANDAGPGAHHAHGSRIPELACRPDSLSRKPRGRIESSIIRSVTTT